MPIYEFRCLECKDLFEVLLVKTNEEEEIQCPHCQAQHFERVLSATSYAMASSSGSGAASSGISKQERTCSSGSCSTYTLPGMD